MEAAAANLTPVVLELGGKDAFIVCEDADLDQVRLSLVHFCLLGLTWTKLMPTGPRFRPPLVQQWLIAGAGAGAPQETH